MSCWGDTYGGIRFLSSVPFFRRYLSAATQVPLPADDYIKVSSGFDADCAITASHKLRCWGNNTYGTLADMSASSGVSTPINANVIDVTIDYTHACAIYGATASDVSGNVSCWGTNNNGQLGSPPDSTIAGQPTPTMVQEVSNATQIVSAEVSNVTCARISDGSVSCWGGDPMHWQVTQAVASGADEIALASLTSPTLFYRTSMGDVLSVQRNSDGTWATPIAVTTMGKVSTISADGTLCGVDLSDPTLVRCTTYPVQESYSVESIHLPAAVKSVSAGNDSSEASLYQCVTLVDGRALCRGSDQSGKLGIGKPENVRAPVLVDLQGSEPIALGTTHAGTAVQVKDGTFRAWGFNPAFFGDQSNHASAQPALAGANAGENVTLSLATSGYTAYLLGQTVRDTVSNGAIENPSTRLFADQGQSSLFLHVAAGTDIDFGATSDTLLGYSTGASTNASHLLPSAMEGGQIILSGVLVREIAYRSDPGQSDSSGHACARLDSGEVRCWGTNTSGETGQSLSNATTWPPMPVTLSSAAPLLAVSLCSGHVHSCAATAEGDVYCWGANVNRETRPDESSVNGSDVPTLVMTLPGGGPYHVSCGESQTCAWTSTEISCWGDNDDAQMGDPDAPLTAGSHRVQVTNMPPAGFDSILDVSVSEFHSCALVGKNGVNAVACWGGNIYGAVGSGPTGTFPDFTRVCGLDAPAMGP